MKLHSIRKNAVGYAGFGCMWSKGELAKDTDLTKALKCVAGTNEVLMQSRILGYWPDGSIKWTGHIADSKELGSEFEVNIVDSSAKAMAKADLNNNDTKIVIEGLGTTVNVTKNSQYIFDEVIADNKSVMKNARLVLKLEEPRIIDGCEAKIVKDYIGKVVETTIEDQGELQTVIKFAGVHESADGDKKIPFILRMTVGKTLKEIRFQHTFIYDGDENKDFLKGLGIEFSAPLTGPLYNRHIKMMTDYGLMHELMMPLSAWHPRVPVDVYKEQLSGKKMELNEELTEMARKIDEGGPHWDTYSITQDSAQHFRIHKKQAGDNLCFIDCLHGNRSNGGVAFGSESGSITVGIRDFWEKYPSGVEVSGLTGDEAKTTIWFYSPEAESYDFRHYANRGYFDVCYEGYEYKGADPDGIACTNECAIVYSPQIIPDDEDVTNFANAVNTIPVYIADPKFYHDMGAFGYWSLPKEGSEVNNWLETQLDNAFNFYKNEIEQRGWYGLFNYGDFMHTYDANRHQWKYDVGGYAWDNTELVPTLWLWLYFIRTGREDVFTVAEKLSRHASEVDVYHMGKYKGLGSRHNVRHWGCPCKEARIAMAHHHRVFYYLTGDRRLEDIFDELKDNEESFMNRDPLGDFYDKATMVYPTHARSGPDWSSLCSNWYTEWERHDDIRYKEKMLIGLNDIKATPLKLTSGPDFEFDPKSLHLRYIGERTTGGSHLQVCMGAPLVWMEMADAFDDEEFKTMIANHGRFAILSHEEQVAESNGLIGNRQFAFQFMFSGMAAYCAWYKKDKELAMKVWRILLETVISENALEGFTPITLNNVGNHKNLSEIPWITTNFVAQWCLNYIMVSQFIGDSCPSSFEEAKELLDENSTGALHRA